MTLFLLRKGQAFNVRKLEPGEEPPPWDAPASCAVLLFKARAGIETRFETGLREVVEVHIDGKQVGYVTPAEAREIAAALNRAADDAEETTNPPTDRKESTT